jgi:hypothetical protein
MPARGSLCGEWVQDGGAVSRAIGGVWLIEKPSTTGVDRVLAADGGAFSLAGGSAEFVRTSAKTLAAEAGAFVLAGGDATFVSTGSRVLNADGGAFFLLGEDAALVRTWARLLQAGAGAFVLTGRDAEFSRPIAGAPLDAEAGAFFFSGAQASLEWVRREAPCWKPADDPASPWADAAAVADRWGTGGAICCEAVACRAVACMPQVGAAWATDGIGSALVCGEGPTVPPPEGGPGGGDGPAAERAFSNGYSTGFE